jgi:hypothetical protein
MLRRGITVAVTAVVLALGGAALAGAATKNGITPLGPSGKIAVGKAPTFRVKVTKPGTVWIHVCKSKRKDSDGVICKTEVIAQARKKSGVFRHKPKLYTFPGFWLQTPGTYYWQAHRIQCEGDLSDCLQEGPIVRIKVG